MLVIAVLAGVEQVLDKLPPGRIVDVPPAPGRGERGTVVVPGGDKSE